MLTIWGRLNSHNVKKVAWFAKELGIPHERHDVGGQFGMSDAYRKLNPNALIPTIEEDGLVLWESNAILRYMAARHDGERFWPADPVARAHGDKWMDWQFSFADAQRDAFKNLVRTPADQRDMEAVALSAKAAGALMQRIEDALSKSDWLSGPEFGIGDIPMGVYAHTFFTLDIARPDLPNVKAWYDRLRTRSAYAETVMIPLT
jgi:glutathione S-transferase